MQRSYHAQNRFRRWWAILVGTAVVAMLLSGCGAQATPKVYRVGVLAPGGPFIGIFDGFKAKMTKLGYVEGQNIVYEMQEVNIDVPGEVSRAAKKLVDNKVDLIFAFPTPAALVAKAATQGTNIPVVFAYAGIEGSNLVMSVREPGGNITGVRYPGPEQISKRLEILHELAPRVKRVWIGYDKNNPNTAPALAALRLAASSQRVTLVEIPVTTLAEIEADLAARAQAADPGMDAIILMPDSINNTPAGWALINKFAKGHHMPLGGTFLFTVEQGAVFGNTTELVSVGELAAPIADKILKGAPAGTIPVYTPEGDLWINYKVAQELGLQVPEGLLRQASKIIR